MLAGVSSSMSELGDSAIALTGTAQMTHPQPIMHRTSHMTFLHPQQALRVLTEGGEASSMPDTLSCVSSNCKWIALRPGPGLAATYVRR